MSTAETREAKAEVMKSRDKLHTMLNKDRDLGAVEEELSRLEPAERIVEGTRAMLNGSKRGLVRG